MTAQQAAALIGCTDRHVRALYHLGKIAGERIGQRLLLFDGPSVEAFARSKRHAGGRPRAPRPAREGDGDGD